MDVRDRADSDDIRECLRMAKEADLPAAEMAKAMGIDTDKADRWLKHDNEHDNDHD